MPPRDFAFFLEASLRVLAREAPASARRVADALGPAGVRVAVDGAARVVRGRGDALLCEAERSPAAVDVATDRTTVLGLVDARTTLMDALLEERFRVRGPVEAVIRFDDALLAYLDGAVRCPSFPTLLRDYRRSSLEERRP